MRRSGCTSNDCCHIRSSTLCVQNQYIFLYETIMEGITHDFDEFPISSLKERMVMLHDFDEDGHSGAEREFKVSWTCQELVCLAINGKEFV